MVRHRWWIVVLLAAIGAGSAYAITTLRNSQIKPAYEATAAVPFVTTEEDERGRAAAQTGLVEAGAKARELTARYTDEGIGLVGIDDRNDEILFTGRGRDEGSASEVAIAMRQAYLDGLATEASQQRQERLEEIVTEAAEILGQIEALDPPEPVEELPDVPPDVAARLTELEQLANALAQQRTKAEVDLILAAAGDDRVGTPEEIQEELDAVNERLEEVYAETAQITAEYGIDPGRVGGQAPVQSTQSTQPSNQSRTSIPDEGVLSSTELADQWTVEALQERYDALSDEYSSFFTEVESGQEPELPEVEVVDVAPQELPPNLYALLGGMIGMLIALGGLYLQKRLRGLVYAPSDVAPIPVLAELPPVSVTAPSPSGRRQRAAVQRRLEGIRRLRATLLTFSEENERTPAIGLAGVNVAGEQVRLLALDVATRVAASDRSVVLFDLDFDLDYSYLEHLEGVSLAELLSEVREQPSEGVKALEAALADVNPGRGACRVIRSGRIAEDPTDLVLTDGFRTLIDHARSHADLILVVLPEASDTLTKTVSRRFDGMLAIGASGVSRRSTLANVIPEAALGGDQAVGLALLTGREAHAGAVRRAMHDGDRPGHSLVEDRTPAFAVDAAESDAALIAPSPRPKRTSKRPLERTKKTAEAEKPTGSAPQRQIAAPRTGAVLDDVPKAPIDPTTPGERSPRQKIKAAPGAVAAKAAPKTLSDPPARSERSPRQKTKAAPAAHAESAAEAAPESHVEPASPISSPTPSPTSSAPDWRPVSPVDAAAVQVEPTVETLAEKGPSVPSAVTQASPEPFPEAEERPAGRVKQTLLRVESALESVIALPGETTLPPPHPVLTDRPAHDERSKVGRALDKVESALGRFIAPSDPTPASGGWTSGAAQDRS